MKASPFSALFLQCVLTAGLAPKADYQPIIDAKPFGDMAAETAADAASQTEQQRQKEEIARKFRMCGITDLPDGTRKIAFLDETSGQAASYLLAIGETQNGFTLVSADYVREYATLTKDGLTLTLGLGKGLIDAPPDDASEVPAPERAAPVPGDTPVAPLTVPAVAVPKGGGSFRARLLRRQAAKAEAEASERRALRDRVAEAEAERIKAARRVQIERIKQGLAPTQPITLTQEEDAELEAAGVFREAKPKHDSEASPKKREGLTPEHLEAPLESPAAAEAARRPVREASAPRLSHRG